MLPLHLDGDILVVASADPTDVVALDDVRMIAGVRGIRAAVTTAGALERAIRRTYGLEGRADELLDAIHSQRAEKEAEPEYDVEDGPVVRLAEGIVTEAMRVGASDIHVEPGPDATAVRYRVDGVLKQVMSVPTSKAGPLISRLKLSAGMDIAERRRPQDGRATSRSDNGEVDLRVSSLPSMHGETLVLRLLRRGGDRLRLSDVGFSDSQRDAVLSAVERPQGLVLLTGPTGSGKTSTLYGFLGHLAGETTNLLTIEDPVEYELPGVSQTQVNERIGFTFAQALRTVLRQDPDVVMVGEIRDPETAELAMQASLTGHLVFSTLHTNSAPGAAVRLRDLGVPSWLVASAVTLIVAQRLVRRVCDACAAPTRPTERQFAQLGLPEGALEGNGYRAGRGCHLCGGSGYRGRTGTFEVLQVNTEVRDLLATNGSEASIRRAAQQAGMQTLRQDGLRLAAQGITTVEEVLRVTPADLDGSSCPVCGQEVEAEFCRCPWCAVPLRPEACARCEQPLRHGWRCCPRCGTSVPGAEPSTLATSLVAALPTG